MGKASETVEAELRWIVEEALELMQDVSECRCENGVRDNRIEERWSSVIS